MSDSGSEDELAVDISQWKPRTVNTNPGRPAPTPVPAQPQFVALTAVMISSDEEESEFGAEEDDSDVEVIDVVEEPEIESEQEDEELEDEQLQPSHRVQVIISQDPDFDRDEYEDCTQEHYILKSVLREKKRRDELLYYEVEFEDGYRDEVSSLSLFFVIIVIVFQFPSCSQSCICFPTSRSCSVYLVLRSVQAEHGLLTCSIHSPSSLLFTGPLRRRARLLEVIRHYLIITCHRATYKRFSHYIPLCSSLFFSHPTSSLHLHHFHIRTDIPHHGAAAYPTNSTASDLLRRSHGTRQRSRSPQDFH